MRTDEEIQKEIEALKAIRPNVVPFSIFEDNNLAKIDVMIRVLEEEMDMDDIEDKFGIYEEDPETENFEDVTFGDYEAARSALDWLEGEEESLAEGWPLIEEKE